MSMDPPIATVTVRFEAGVTGEQLAALVQRVVKRGGQYVDFVVDHRYYDDRDLLSFGQKGEFFHGHIQVLPSIDLVFFQPDEHYSEVLVTSHSWGGEDDKRRFAATDRRMILDAVRNFADALADAYRAALIEGFPEYVEPE